MQTGQYCSSGHHCHPTERAAQNALRWARKQPGGKGLRWLNVFKCQVCDGWSVGRAWRGSRERQAAQPQPATVPKQPTPARLRRAAKRKAEFDARQAYYADWHDTLMHVKRMVDAEIARLEALGVPKRTLGTGKAETALTA